MLLPLTHIHRQALDAMCQKFTSGDGDHRLPQAKWEHNNNTLIVSFTPRTLGAESELDTPAEAVYCTVAGVFPGIRLCSCVLSDRAPYENKVVMVFSYQPVKVDIVHSTNLNRVFSVVRRFPMLCLMGFVLYLLRRLWVFDTRYWYRVHDRSTSVSALFYTYMSEYAETKAYPVYRFVTGSATLAVYRVLILTLSHWARVGTPKWYRAAIQALDVTNVVLLCINAFLFLIDCTGLRT
jgi:hypothetical protein